MRRALFIVSMLGQGHLVRSRALASELTNRGWGCTMTNRSPLSASSYDVSVVDMGDDDAVADIYTTLSARPVVAVVDRPGDVDAQLVVFGNAGAEHWMASSKRHHGVTLFGPHYALLRPEFREWRSTNVSSSVADLREVKDLTAAQLAEQMLGAGKVITYGGMRALEAACVRGNAMGMTIEARNDGEELNKAGLLADPTVNLVDGLGCKRVADAIEGLA